MASASAANSKGERTWGGSTLSARKAQRRETLIEATLNLIGEEGARGVTVRSVCRKAGLTDRYFYESFSSRDELLVAVFLQVSGEIAAAISSAVQTAANEEQHEQARRALEALAMAIVSDPRRGRLLFTESLAEPALIVAGLAAVPTLNRVFRQHFMHGGTRTERALRTVSISGAITALFLSWQTGQLKVSVDELVEFCAELIVPTRD